MREVSPKFWVTWPVPRCILFFKVALQTGWENGFLCCADPIFFVSQRHNLFPTRGIRRVRLTRDSKVRNKGSFTFTWSSTLDVMEGDLFWAQRSDSERCQYADGQMRRKQTGLITTKVEFDGNQMWALVESNLRSEGSLRFTCHFGKEPVI